MRKLSQLCITVSLLFLITGPVQALEVTYEECNEGCMTGNNPCSRCCRDSFRPVIDPCLDRAGKKYRQCLMGLQPWERTKKQQCEEANWHERNRCYKLDTKLNLSCPGWMKPYECPFNCQTFFNHKCIGPAMNSCNW